MKTPLRGPDLAASPRRLRLLSVLWVSGLVLGACATLPDVSQRPPVRALPAAIDGSLARLAAHSVPSDGPSGFRLMVSGDEALQARLALIERATVSLDLQYYQFKSDATARLLLRALRDAAARHVRVRLLLDDLYTAGDDALWLGLAEHANVEVRLFNPFMAGRESHVGRMLDVALGDKRLHRRMHNKLFLADGALAVTGGRNIGDAYFQRDAQQAYFDIDVLVAGTVLPQMVAAFDAYWNSDYSHDVRVIAADAAPAEARRARFAAQLAAPEVALARRESRAGDALMQEFAQGRLAMLLAPAKVAFDAPHKIEHTQAVVDLGELALAGSQVRLLVGQAIRQAQQELVLVSPYLIPGPTGVAALQGFRARGVRVTLLTNSLAATDEPLVHIGYRQYRVAILKAGVELFEWSPARHGRVFREFLAGGTVLRLHAKCALVDRRLVYLGSMNFDPRSRDWNTEFGLLIDSPELAAQVHTLIADMARQGSHRVLLGADDTLRWQGLGGAEGEVLEEPDTDPGSRLLLDLLAPFVPEEML